MRIGNLGFGKMDLANWETAKWDSAIWDVTITPDEWKILEWVEKLHSNKQITDRAKCND